MTYEERLIAVINGKLPPEILTEEEILDLQERVMAAIAFKKASLTGMHLTVQ